METCYQSQFSSFPRTPFPFFFFFFFFEVGSYTSTGNTVDVYRNGVHPGHPLFWRGSYTSTRVTVNREPNTEKDIV